MSFPDADLLGISLILAVMLLVGLVVSLTRWPRTAKLILYAALVLRVIGSLMREAIATDAAVYFKWGVRYAEYFRRFDLSPIFDPTLWRGYEWVGSNFIGYPTGFIVALIGPTRVGTFFVFALIALIGVGAYAFAFRRSFPHANYLGYWAWVFLFPSLWFWPSSIGKECIITLGFGLATLGFAGRGGRTNWPMMILGLLVVFVIRPQLVAVFTLAVVLAHWLNFRDWSPGRLLQGSALLIVGLAGIWFAMANTRAGGADLESLEEYVDENVSRSSQGGSEIESVSLSPANVPVVIMNVLFRPFIWEAHNVTSLFAALELTLMWAIIWFRRRKLLHVFQIWRRHRMLRFAIPFVFLYVVALGFNLTNLGLIARQRTLVFPLLFMIVEAGNIFQTEPEVARSARGARHSKRGLTPA